MYTVEELQRMMRSLKINKEHQIATLMCIDIVKAVCKVCKTMPVTLKTQDKHRNNVDRRIITAYLMTQRGFTVYQIGKLLHRERTTIIYYLKQFNNLIHYDVGFTENYKQIKEVLYAN